MMTKKEARKELKKLAPHIERVMSLPEERIGFLDAMVLAKAEGLYRIINDEQIPDLR